MYESPEENYRVRKCVLYWYLATDCIEISEPRTNNSGMTQGKFLQHARLKYQTERLRSHRGERLGRRHRAYAVRKNFSYCRL